MIIGNGPSGSIVRLLIKLVIVAFAMTGGIIGALQGQNILLGIVCGAIGGAVLAIAIMVVISGGEVLYYFQNWSTKKCSIRK